ncbi:MAG TPA: serine/threonine-protein kinase [Polyangiales bacterium]
MSTPKQHRLIGKVVADRYRIVELLGEGGMGAVYLAEHLTLHKQVALKVVHAEHAKNPELAERFSREAMATSRIEHPNVISAIDFGKLNDGTAYLAVQLVRGPSLSRVLSAEGPMPWPRTATIGAQIADALCAAHGHGIVHRDLKPDNVHLQYLDNGGEMVKVLDFGVAKFSGVSAPKGSRADVTQVGFIVGTPGYMAPEQAVGQASDERADLYSLGVILWESIVGRQLWKAPDLQHLVERQLVETAPKLSSVSPDTSIPPLLDDLVAALLARRAADRPPDAATVRDTLREVVRMGEEEAQRWRTGARPVPASLRGATPAGNVPAAKVPGKGDGQVPGDGRAAPRHPLSSLPTRVRTSKTAWVFAGLLSAILLAAGFMIATGRIELRPRKDVAAAVERVAEQLNLPTPAVVGTGVDEYASVEALGPSTTGLPRALESTYAKLLEGGAERNDAADALLSHVPADEIPQYVRRVARLTLARTCSEKRTEIEQLAEVKDPRSLPALIRLAQKPKYGCGRKRRDDCFACLREPLDALIAELEQSSATKTR